MLDMESINELQTVAEQNHGRCDRCHQVIAIYRYKVNKQMATVLRKMRAEIDANGENKINFDSLDIPYRLASQRSKMRLHGLIAKYKENGVHVSNTWLITKKGGDFLRGEAIAEKVIVFDNKVIGHEGELVDIHRLMDEVAYESEAVTTPEAEVYSQTREGFLGGGVLAEYRGSGLGTFYKPGEQYTLEMGKLIVGEPVQILAPHTQQYPDIARFQKEWKIIRRISNEAN